MNAEYRDFFSIFQHQLYKWDFENAKWDTANTKEKTFEAVILWKYYWGRNRTKSWDLGYEERKEGSWQMESGRFQAQGAEGLKAWIQEWEGEIRFGKV